MNDPRAKERLSRNFTLVEFRSPDGVEMPPGGLLAYRRLCEWMLQPMRDQFGKCTVHSGHRSLAHNRAVHGAVKSVHLLRSRLPNASGLAAAADVSFARGSVAEWEDMAVLLRGTQPHLAERGRGGIGRYDRAGFVHLDTWTWRTWSG